MYLLVFGLIAAVLILSVLILKNRKNTHVTEVTINRSFEVMWKWVSDPTKYPQIYPNWIKNVAELGNSEFRIDDKFGQSYDMKLIADKKYGVVDLQMGAEISRSRVYPIDENSTAIVHLGRRWKGLNQIEWFFFKRTVDRDLKNTKKVIESS